MLRVSQKPDGQPEVFYSLQGEGATIGTPSVFLRLAMCNLACTWCDTRYTWDWERFDYAREVGALDAQQVEARILGFGCPRLVITGGEPLLQQQELAPLTASLKEKGFYIEVETNGTIIPEKALAGNIDQWNVSPKLRNSGIPLDRRQPPQALEAFRGLPNAYFKFVVVAPEDVDEVLSLTRRCGLPRERVILMPEGRTVEALLDRGRWVSEACVKEGFRFSTRLHILLWGDKRGQ